ncbi:hypothetical protein GUJ93_ZPchr0006g41573 [Zizania palustris]|uniref:Uncharacterized protein n=1 Tax=Zizania palustris TaxID=103762 RepID=A0A8J5STU0_ZIZPA|nr:hypothetical protein GUJ93_ZPchr0006g41573 [Zizania palustris]
MAAIASNGGCGSGGEWEIYNEDGFVYKRRRGPHHPDCEDAAAPSTAAPSPDSVLLRRRRQALLQLRAKYLLELSRWDSLSKDLLAPLPALPAALPRAPSDPIAASAPDFSDLDVVDDLLAQAEVMDELLNKLSQACDEINELCDAHEATLVDAVAVLPVWGDPRELMNSLCSTHEQPVPATN